MSALRDVRRAIAILNQKEKRRFLSLVIWRSAANALDVAGIAGVALFGAMLAAGLAGGESASIAGVSISLSDPIIYLWVIATVVAVFLAKSSLSTLLLRLTGVFLAKVEASRAVEAMEFIYGDTLEHRKKFEEKFIHWTLTNSATAAFSNLLMNFSVLISELTLFLLLFAAFAVLHLPTTALVALYFVVLLGVFQSVVGRLLKRSGEELKSSYQETVSLLNDISRAFREIRVVPRGLATYASRFRAIRSSHSRTWARIRFFDGAPRFFIEAALLVGVLGLVAWQFSRGDLAESMVITSVFLVGGLRMMGALLPLQNALSWIRSDGPQAQDVLDVLEKARSSRGVNRPQTARLQTTGPTVDLTTRAPDLMIRNVSFSYMDSEEEVLKDISMEIRSGEFVAIIGSSGAGKTTLIDIILGIQEPSAGTVTIDGVEPRALLAMESGAVSYLPQAPALVAGSLLENVGLAREIASIQADRVQEMLAIVGLSSDLKVSGNSFANLTKPVHGLSVGQTQRLGLARALYQRPCLLVLDEPTSALDTAAEAQIVDTIESLRKRTTLIVVAHRLSTVQQADRVMVLQSGSLIASGSFEDLAKTVPGLESYLRPKIEEN